MLLEDFKTADAERKKHIKFIRGHIEFGLHRYLFEPYRYITILRDPIERMISWYYFLLQDKNSYGYQKFVLRSDGFEDFVRKGFGGVNSIIQMLIEPEEYKKIAGEKARLETAKENLVNYMTAVGTVESFDETLILFKNKLGWRYLPIYSKENVTHSRPKKSDLPASTIDAILERNREDVEFFQFAGQVFQEQYAQAGTEYNKQLVKLKLLNQSYGRILSAVAGKDYVKALELLNPALALEENNPDLNKLLGMALFGLGDELKALQAFVKSMEYNPYDAQTIKYCIVLLEKFHRHSEAEMLKQGLGIGD